MTEQKFERRNCETAIERTTNNVERPIDEAVGLGNRTVKGQKKWEF
jgi:hypothetical protein